MFDFSFGEFLLVALVAVIFIQPKDVPVVLRAAARVFKWLRGMAAEIRAMVDDMAKESGLKDVQEEVEREVRMITGDDGKEYESYDISDLPRRHE